MDEKVQEYLSSLLGVSKVQVIDDPATLAKIVVLHIPVNFSILGPQDAAKTFVQTCQRVDRAFTYPTRPDTQTVQDRQRGFE